MKITPETKIKDLIKEGYELSEKHLEVDGDDDVKRIVINLKKKEEKNFEWYKNEYIRYIKKVCGYELHFNHEWIFEYRIGLLKFICKDLNINWIRFLWRDTAYILESEIDKIRKICPEEFLNSLID